MNFAEPFRLRHFFATDVAITGGSPHLIIEDSNGNAVPYTTSADGQTRTFTLEDGQHANIRSDLYQNNPLTAPTDEVTVHDRGSKVWGYRQGRWQAAWQGRAPDVILDQVGASAVYGEVPFGRGSVRFTYRGPSSNLPPQP